MSKNRKNRKIGDNLKIRKSEKLFLQISAPFLSPTTNLVLFVFIRAMTIHEAAGKCDQSRMVELNPKPFDVDSIQASFINLLNR